MTVEVARFSAAVTGPDGAALGEARFWASVERDGDDGSWCGWLQITDLRKNELAAGRYRLDSVEGWEAEFEPLAGRPSRVFEIDLLPIRGIGVPPWPDSGPPERPRAIPFSDDRPPRTADDRTRFPDLPPIDFAPRDPALPADLPWPTLPEGE